MRRLLMVVAVALAVVACEPQMELGLVVHRTGTLSEVGSDTGVALSGQVFCTRSEPVDFFLKATQQGRTVSASSREGAVQCQGGDEGTGWSLVFRFPTEDFPRSGSASIRLKACTNPARDVDEDCVTVERLVDLT